MANLDPEKKSDYRDVTNPKVRSRDILIWMVNEGRATFTAPEVADEFCISKADAAARLLRLKGWHCLQILIRGKGNTAHQYRVTDWGHDCARRWQIKGDKND